MTLRLFHYRHFLQKPICSIHQSQTNITIRCLRNDHYILKQSNLNLNVHSRRNLFGLSFRHRIIHASPFTFAFIIGFCSLSGLSVAQYLWEKYNSSNMTLTEMFSWSENSNNKDQIDMSENNDLLDTKYASILSIDNVPVLKPSRTVSGKITLPNIKITLYQYQTCPFCCKVRAFLDYYGLPYDVIEVNPVMRQQLKFSKKYKKVPMVLITSDGSDQVLQINDSTLIISTLTSYLLSLQPKSRHFNESVTNITKWYLNNNIFSNEIEEELDFQKGTFKVKKSNEELVNRYFLMIGDVDPTKYEKIDPPLAEERRWRRWVDDHFVHVLSPNIYRTYDESLKSFNYFSDVGEWPQNFSNLERMFVINVGAVAMYFVSKRLKRKYNLKDDVRESLYDSCNFWLKGIGKNRVFMGGDIPNLADLAVYGALSSIEGCEAFSDLMSNTKMSKWYYNMKTIVEKHYGSEVINNLF